jgi:hypothetical protein
MRGESEMVFEAHYSARRLVILGILALAIAALGLYMLSQTTADFEGASSRRLGGLAAMSGTSPETVGHAIGWICLLAGIGLLPLLVKFARHQGPALRVDEKGVFWHRWSDTAIRWSNIARIEPYVIQNQKMVGLTLVDRDQDRPPTLMRKLGRLNNALGKGDVALTLQGTDGNYDDLLVALAHYHLAGT